ncbi:MAG: DUF3347 domain-containing protein [Mesonia hippocampi]|uniref:DUF3347 domain-containing protein n=1 Tax=Mesonia hippocampi TaxID=1628250 RepID=UPI003F9BD1BF
MRKTKIILSLGIFALSFTACKQAENKQATEEKTTATPAKEVKQTSELSFKEAHVNKVYKDYILLKDALVKSDANTAKQAAEKISTSAKNEEIIRLAKDISKTDDIEKIRVLFFDLSKQVETLANDNITSGKVYKQFCPMAFNDTGAFWLSSEENVLNPYFGEKMLRCGMVQKTIQ